MKDFTFQLPRGAGVVDIGTASLYHEVHGTGPTVVLISGATGGAEQWTLVVPPLARGCTVVTYDRRGFSRSPRPPGWTATSVEEQADDAAALLRTVDLAPAVVVGHSAGASILCSLIARHGEVVRHALCYEPPLVAVVGNGEHIVAELRARVEQARAEGGYRGAMERIIWRGFFGDEVADRLFASFSPAELDRVLANGDVFFPLEMPVFMSFAPDRDRLRKSGVPLTVALSQVNRDTWFGEAARWLAKGTGANRTGLPGGHAGFVSHPEAFVELVTRIAQPRSLAETTHADS
jgi:pimeloyl-ACP methyl ester carboxylesterase